MWGSILATCEKSFGYHVKNLSNLPIFSWVMPGVNLATRSTRFSRKSCRKFHKLYYVTPVITKKSKKRPGVTDFKQILDSLYIENPVCSGQYVRKSKKMGKIKENGPTKNPEKCKIKFLIKWGRYSILHGVNDRKHLLVWNRTMIEQHTIYTRHTVDWTPMGFNSLWMNEQHQIAWGTSCIK